jgi:hypothetical protein
VSGFPRNVNHAVDLNSFYGYAPAINRSTGGRGHHEHGGGQSRQDRCTGVAQDDFQQGYGRSGCSIRRHKQTSLPDEIRPGLYLPPVELCGEQKNAAQMQDKADDKQDAARPAHRERCHGETSSPECSAFWRIRHPAARPGL